MNKQGVWIYLLLVAVPCVEAPWIMIFPFLYLIQ